MNQKVKLSIHVQSVEHQCRAAAPCCCSSSCSTGTSASVLERSASLVLQQLHSWYTLCLPPTCWNITRNEMCPFVLPSVFEELKQSGAERSALFSIRIEYIYWKDNMGLWQTDLRRWWWNGDFTSSKASEPAVFFSNVWHLSLMMEITSSADAFSQMSPFLGCAVSITVCFFSSWIKLPTSWAPDEPVICPW